MLSCVNICVVIHRCYTWRKSCSIDGAMPHHCCQRPHIAVLSARTFCTFVREFSSLGAYGGWTKKALVS